LFRSPRDLADEYLFPAVVKLRIGELHAEGRAQGGEVGRGVDLAALVTLVVMVRPEPRLDGGAIAPAVERPPRKYAVEVDVDDDAPQVEQESVPRIRLNNLHTSPSLLT